MTTSFAIPLSVRPSTPHQLQDKLGPNDPKRLVVPEAVTDRVLHIGDTGLEILEFGECECKHIAAAYIPAMQALLAADLVYNCAHLYVA